MNFKKLQAMQAKLDEAILADKAPMTAEERFNKTLVALSVEIAEVANTVEHYYIPLPDLETSDGIQQVLSQRKGDKNYFASRPAETLKQRYTKEEIAQVPEIYKYYATLIEEEEE